MCAQDLYTSWYATNNKVAINHHVIVDEIIAIFRPKPIWNMTIVVVLTVEEWWAIMNIRILLDLITACEVLLQFPFISLTFFFL